MTRSLDARFESDTPLAFLNGNHALIRMMVEQMRSDAAAGLRTKAFVTGYPGSPLGSIDIAWNHAPGRAERGVRRLDVDGHPDAGRAPSPGRGRRGGLLVRKRTGAGPFRRRSQACELCGNEPPWRRRHPERRGPRGKELHRAV